LRDILRTEGYRQDVMRGCDQKQGRREERRGEEWRGEGKREVEESVGQYGRKWQQIRVKSSNSC
jgi:hypothetical protein